MSQFQTNKRNALEFLEICKKSDSAEVISKELKPILNDGHGTIFSVICKILQVMILKGWIKLGLDGVLIFKLRRFDI